MFISIINTNMNNNNNNIIININININSIIIIVTIISSSSSSSSSSTVNGRGNSLAQMRRSLRPISLLTLSPLRFLDRGFLGKYNRVEYRI